MVKKLGSKLTALVALTAQQVRRLAKPREGFVAYAQPMIALYQARAKEWSIKGKTPDSMLELLSAYQWLLQMEEDSARQHQLIQETRAQRGSDLWTGTLDIYALAKAASRNDPELAHAIAAFEQFMKRAHRSKKPVVAPVTPTTPTPATGEPTDES